MVWELEGAGAESRGAQMTSVRGQLVDPRWALYGALVVLNVLDVITTSMVIGRGGAERNPFVQPFVDNMMQVAGLKAIVLVVVAVLLARCPGSRLAELALTGTAGWYLAVVLWNATVLTVA